jgi:hypothetical protein
MKRTFILVVSLFTTMAAVGSARTVFSDMFDDGNRTDIPNGGNWYKYNGANTILTVTSNLTMTTIGTTGRGVEVNFGAQRLSTVGSKITLTFDMQQINISNAIDRVRIGLYNSNGGTAPTALTADAAATVGPEVTNRVGYFATLDTRTSGGTGTVVLRNTAQTNLAFSVTGANSLGSVNGINIFDTNCDTVTWSIERTGPSEYTHIISVVGGGTGTWVHSTGGQMTDTYDTFVLYETGGLSTFSVDNVRLETPGAD